jgi:hypothetical protein
VRSALVLSVAVGLAALACSVRRPTRPEADPCKPGGNLVHTDLSEPSTALTPVPATQSGIDVVGDSGAAVISLLGLEGPHRGCPVADFSALSRLSGLVAVQGLPAQCLPAFARTARPPMLREIEIRSNYHTAIDVASLLVFPGLTTIALGNRPRESGTLAPLAGLPHLTTLFDDSGQLDGIETLTQLTHLQIWSFDGKLPSLTRQRALQTLALVLWATTDLGQLGTPPALEQLVLHPQTKAIDVAPLARLTSLRRLDVHVQTIEHGAALARLSSLCALDVSEAQSGVSLSSLADLKRLEYLAVDVTAAPSLEPLAHLRRLETLVLWGGCNDAPIDLAPLVQLPALKRVSLTAMKKVANRAPLDEQVDLKGPDGCGPLRP